MCGCKQGTCPGGCRCGCSHTPPAPPERTKRPIDRIGTVDAALANEVAGIVIDETSGYARFSDRYSIAVRVIELFAGRESAPAPSPTTIEARALSGEHVGRTIRVAKSGLTMRLTGIEHGTGEMRPWVEGTDPFDDEEVGDFLAPADVVEFVQGGDDL